MALQDAGAENSTSVFIEVMRVTHKQNDWVGESFKCSEEIQKWQQDLIYDRVVDPMQIEFDKEDKVARQVF